MFSRNCLSLRSVARLIFQSTCCLHLVLATYKHSNQNANQRLKLQTDHPEPGNVDPNSDSSLFEQFALPLSADESKLRLAMLVDDKFDRDHDGFVQLDELVSWLRECQDKYAKEDVNRHWIQFNKHLVDDESHLTWDAFTVEEYKTLAELARKSESQQQLRRIQSSHEESLRKDLRRWQAADENQDGRLTKLEFKNFLYPESSQHMHKVVVQERFEALDKNKDKRVSIDEYLSDLTMDESYFDSEKREKWMQEQRDKFSGQIDVNGDGYLDESELSVKMSQEDFHDHSVSEAQHLMQAADVDKDHKLTKEEILQTYNEFVNSHATDFGEALQRQRQPTRDEL